MAFAGRRLRGWWQKEAGVSQRLMTVDEFREAKRARGQLIVITDTGDGMEPEQLILLANFTL